MSLMQKQTVAEVIVESLLRHGVEVMFSQSLPSAVLLVPGLSEALKVSVPIVALVQDSSFEQSTRN